MVSQYFGGMRAVLAYFSQHCLINIRREQTSSGTHRPRGTYHKRSDQRTPGRNDTRIMLRCNKCSPAINKSLPKREQLATPVAELLL